jgi:hypothetical protein
VDHSERYSSCPFDVSNQYRSTSTSYIYVPTRLQHFRCAPLIHPFFKMARLPWVAQIRNARNNAEQIDVLRALKNEIVGHPPQKELVVTLGVLEPIIRLTFNKNGTRQDGKSHDYSFSSRPLSEEEMVRLQCLQVIASIALGEHFHLPNTKFLLNLCTRRSPLPSAATGRRSLACHSVKPLPFEQSVSVSLGFTSRTLESCRFVRLSIQHTRSEHQRDRGRPLHSPKPELLISYIITVFSVGTCSESDIHCIIFNQ